MQGEPLLPLDSIMLQVGEIGGMASMDDFKLPVVRPLDEE